MPWPGEARSWRHTPPTAMILQVMSGLLVLCLGMLLGTTWTTQAAQPKLRRQAEERRRLNDEWSAVRAARRQRSECPRCGSGLVPRVRQESQR